MPSNALAEIISGVSVTPKTDQSPWQIAEVLWNGMQVPVISFEQMMISRFARLRGSHVAIIRGTEDNDGLPFYGVAFQAVPHNFLLDADSDLVEENTGIEKFNLIQAKVRIRGIAAVIPDLQAIEKQLLADL